VAGLLCPESACSLHNWQMQSTTEVCFARFAAAVGKPLRLRTRLPEVFDPCCTGSVVCSFALRAPRAKSLFRGNVLVPTRVIIPGTTLVGYLGVTWEGTWVSDLGDQVRPATTYLIGAGCLVLHGHAHKIQ